MNLETLPAELEPSAVVLTHVLVVDSSVEDAKTIARLIRQAKGGQVRVTIAHTILDGLREFRHERPDCVLVNQHVNGGDGVEFLRMLNDITAPLPAPVVFLSGADSPRLAVRVLKAGAMDFLSKSWIDAESLFHAIDGAVANSEQTRQRIQSRIETEDSNQHLQTQLEAIRETERINQLIAGRAPVFLYVNDILQDRNVYANQTMLDGLGYTEAEWTGMPPGAWSERIHPEDVDAYQAHLKSFGDAIDGKTFGCEYRVRRIDGAYLNLGFRESVFLRNEHGLVWQVVGFAEELTSRAVVRLSDSSADAEPSELRSLWDQKGVGLAVTEGAGQSSIRLNPQLAEWLNMDQSVDLIELSRGFGFTPGASPFRKVFTKNAPVVGAERTIFRPDGTELKLLETIVPRSEGDAGFMAYYFPATSGSNLESGTADPRLKDLEKKLTASERELEATRSRLAASEEISKHLRELLDETPEGTVQTSEAKVDQALARARAAEERLNELDNRWRETLNLLLSADEIREKLKVQVSALQDEITESSQKNEQEREAQASLIESQLDQLTSTQESLNSAHDELRQLREAAQQTAEVLEVKLHESVVKDEFIADLLLAVDKFRTIEEELNDLQSQLTSAVARSTTLENEAKILDAEKQAGIATVASLTEQLANSDKQVIELDRDLTDSRRDRAILEASHRDLLAAAESERSRADGLDERRLELEGALQRAFVEISDFTGANHALEEKLREVEGHHEKATQDLLVLEAEKQNATNSLKEATEREVAAAQALREVEAEQNVLALRLENSEAASRAATDEIQRIKAVSSEESERLEKLLAGLQADLDRREEAIDELREQARSARADVQTAQAARSSLAAQVEAIESQLLSAQTKLHDGEERWWKTYKDVEAKDRELAEATQSRDLMGSELAKTQDHSAKLEANIIELNAQLANVMQLAPDEAKHLEAATLRLFDLQVELVEAQSLAQERGKDAEKSRLEAKRSASDLGKAKDQLSKVTKSVTELEARVEALTASQSEAHARTAELEASHGNLTETAQNAEATLAETRKNLDSVTADLNEARLTEAELRERVGKLEQEVQDGTSRYEELLKEHAEAIHSAEQNMIALQERNADAVQAQQSLVARESELEALAARLSATEDEVQQKLTETQLQLQAKTEEAAKLSADLETTMSTLISAESGLGASQAGMAEREELVSDLASKLGATEQLLAALQLSARTLEEALSESEAEALQANAALTETRERLRITDADLVRTTDALKLAQDEVEVLRRRVAEDEQLLKDSVQRFHEAQLQLSESHERVRTLELELRTETQSHRDAKNALLAVQTELEASHVERKQAQTELMETTGQLRKALDEQRRAEESYRALAASTPCIVFTATVLGFVDQVNAQWQALTGIAIETAQEDGWGQAIFAEDLGAFTKTWSDGIASREPFSLQFRLRRKDGTFRWHAMQCNPQMEGDRLIKWIGTMTEIHEQVSAREAARQARMRYAAVLDNTRESFLFLSPTGHVLGASKAALSLLHNAEGVVGTPLWETKWWPKSEQEKLEHAVQSAATGHSSNFETARVDREKQHRAARVKVMPVKDENDQVALLVSHFEDL